MSVQQQVSLAESQERLTALKRLSRRLGVSNNIAMAVLWLITILVAALFLVEYSRQGRFITVIHFAAETLAGVPSLVLGMFGFLVFAVYAHMGTSRLAGALTLLCLNFPLALRLFEEALAAVPGELREGGLALGATRWHMIRTVVLPFAL